MGLVGLVPAAWSTECCSRCKEMDRKKDLIRQIRALEKVPVEKFKQLGPAK